MNRRAVILIPLLASALDVVSDVFVDVVDVNDVVVVVVFVVVEVFVGIVLQS